MATLTLEQAEKVGATPWAGKKTLSLADAEAYGAKPVQVSSASQAESDNPDNQYERPAVEDKSDVGTLGAAGLAGLNSAALGGMPRAMGVLGGLEAASPRTKEENEPVSVDSIADVLTNGRLLSQLGTQAASRAKQVWNTATGDSKGKFSAGYDKAKADTEQGLGKAASDHPYASFAGGMAPMVLNPAKGMVQNLLVPGAMSVFGSGADLGKAAHGDVDELKRFGKQGAQNLALAAAGAKAPIPTAIGMGAVGLGAGDKYLNLSPEEKLQFLLSGGTGALTGLVGKAGQGLQNKAESKINETLAPRRAELETAKTADSLASRAQDLAVRRKQDGLSNLDARISKVGNKDDIVARLEGVSAKANEQKHGYMNKTFGKLTALMEKNKAKGAADKVEKTNLGEAAYKDETEALAKGREQDDKNFIDAFQNQEAKKSAGSGGGSEHPDLDASVAGQYGNAVKEAFAYAARMKEQNLPLDAELDAALANIRQPYGEKGAAHIKQFADVPALMEKIRAAELVKRAQSKNGGKVENPDTRIGPPTLAEEVQPSLVDRFLSEKTKARIREKHLPGEAEKGVTPVVGEKTGADRPQALAKIKAQEPIPVREIEDPAPSYTNKDSINLDSPKWQKLSQRAADLEGRLEQTKKMAPEDVLASPEFQKKIQTLLNKKNIDLDALKLLNEKGAEQSRLRQDKLSVLGKAATPESVLMQGRSDLNPFVAATKPLETLRGLMGGGDAATYALKKAGDIVSAGGATKALSTAAIRQPSASSVQALLALINENPELRKKFAKNTTQPTVASK